MPAVNSSSSAMLNRQLYLLTANAIALEKNRMRMIDGIRMNIVFMNVWVMFPCVHASLKFCRVSACGHEKMPYFCVSA